MFKRKKSIDWQSIEYFDDKWNRRTEKLYEYVYSDAKKIADLGCGKQFLRSIIRSDILYLPFDYIKRSPDTVVVDFNSRQDFDLSLFNDVVFMSGFLEYIECIDDFLPLFANSNQVVLSYCDTDNYSDIKAREKLAWKNHMSKLDVISKFLEMGFVLSNIDEISKNGLYNFIKHESR